MLEISEKCKIWKATTGKLHYGNINTIIRNKVEKQNKAVFSELGIKNVLHINGKREERSQKNTTVQKENKNKNSEKYTNLH